MDPLQQQVQNASTSKDLKEAVSALAPTRYANPSLKSPETLRIFLSKRHLIRGKDGAWAVGMFFYWYAYDDSRRQIVTSPTFAPQVYEMFILDAFPRAASRASCEQLSVGLNNVTCNNFNNIVERFTTKETYTTLLSIMPKVQVEGGGDVLVFSLINILNEGRNAQAVELFGTQEFLDAFKNLKASTLWKVKFDAILSILAEEVDRKKKTGTNSHPQTPATAAATSSSTEAEKLRQLISSLQLQLQQKDSDLQKEQHAHSTTKRSLQQCQAQLQSKDAEINNLKQEILRLKNLAPFVQDKPYQVDYNANGLAQPDPSKSVGALLSVSLSSPIFNEAKNLMKKLGTFSPVPKPVAGFTLESVDVIDQNVAGFEVRMNRLQQLRTQGGSLFNHATGTFSAEQLQVLIALRDQFLPRSQAANEKAPNLINVFHGTKVDNLPSVVNGLVAVRSTDAGYFGSGVYTTPNIEYAARYATGEFNLSGNRNTPRTSDGCFPVVWCVAAVGVCYPLTREKDYEKKRIVDGMAVSDFFGTPLSPGFDCHCVCVSESTMLQASSRREMQYMEIVFDQEVQVLPIAVLWMKPM